MPKVILVTGATGKQGGAVVDHLLQSGSNLVILAVTRDITSPSATRLSQKSSRIRLVQGDLDDSATIFKNAKGVVADPVWGVYSVQAAMIPEQTIEREERQGKALIDESIRNGVKHFVYSSVDRGGDKSFETPTPVPHFASKYRIEHYLLEKCSGGKMDWTILRPVGFLDNYIPGFQGKLFFTAWKVAARHRPQQLVAVSDIGYFAAQAFMHPEDYKSKSLSIAGDELSFDEAAKVFQEKTGHTIPTTFGFIASLILYTSKDVGIMFKWFRDEGFGADIQKLKKLHPGLVDFGTYIEEQSGFVGKGPRI